MSTDVRFFTENIRYLLRRKKEIRHWILEAVNREGMTAGDLNIILCDDAYLLELNLKYLRHKTLTDIITFAFEDENGRISGDIYISVPRVKENAVKFGVRTEEELHRVIIHGVLHLAGYKDKTKEEKTRMRGKENEYLALLGMGLAGG